MVKIVLDWEFKCPLCISETKHMSTYVYRNFFYQNIFRKPKHPLKSFPLVYKHPVHCLIPKKIVKIIWIHKIKLLDIALCHLAFDTCFCRTISVILTVVLWFGAAVLRTSFICIGGGPSVGDGAIGDVKQEGAGKRRRLSGPVLLIAIPRCQGNADYRGRTPDVYFVQSELKTGFNHCTVNVESFTVNSERWL